MSFFSIYIILVFFCIVLILLCLDDSVILSHIHHLMCVLHYYVLCSSDTFITSCVYTACCICVSHIYHFMCIYCVCFYVQAVLRPGARTADRQAAVAFCGERNVCTRSNRTCVGLGLGPEGGMSGGPGNYYTAVKLK